MNVTVQDASSLSMTCTEPDHDTLNVILPNAPLQNLTYIMTNLSIDNCSSNMYETVGIPSSEYTIDKLYDRNHPDNNWPKEEVIDKINNGAKIINHLGHSYYGYNMKMINEDVVSLNNNPLCFIYSQGCMAGGFDDPDDYDCIAEYHTVKTDYAAFAVIMNARYGWGVVGSTNGPSQHFHRQFLDAIYGEGIPQIGKANQDSKEDNLARLNGACMRWCYYQLNLFGDPTLTMYEKPNNLPTTPSKPTGVERGKIGMKYSFSTIADDADNDLLYYKFDWGDGSTSDWLGPYNPGEEITALHNWSKFGNYKIQVKARDEHRAESDWSEPTTIKIRFARSVPRFSNNFQILKSIFQFFFKLLPS